MLSSVTSLLDCSLMPLFARSCLLITLFKDLNVAYGAVLRHILADFGKIAEKGGSLLPFAHTTIFSLDDTQL